MENKKKNNTLLIVVIVVISLLLVGTLAYFTYDKIFKEDKPIEENKDNKDNDTNVDNNDNKGDTDEDGVEIVNYGDKHFVKISTPKREIVIKNFDFNDKKNELSFIIGDYDNSKEKYPMSIYLNDILVAEVEVSSNLIFYVLDYNNYYVIYSEGTYNQDLFILSSDNKIVRSLVGNPYAHISIDTDGSFDGVISQTTYEKKDNYMIEENIEKIDLNGSDVSSKSSNDKINCKTYTDKAYDCLCDIYFDINKYNSQCS